MMNKRQILSPSDRSSKEPTMFNLKLKRRQTNQNEGKNIVNVTACNHTFPTNGRNFNGVGKYGQEC